MIMIDRHQISAKVLSKALNDDANALRVLDIMNNSGEIYRFESENELIFELNLRAAIIAAAEKLRKSGMQFKVFRDSFCNKDYWIRESDGGFALKQGMRPSVAIEDIFKNGGKYATECATAMEIIYYRALLDVLGETTFNGTFKDIKLMDWRYLGTYLRKTGLLTDENSFLPGDRRYFKNPDVSLRTPEWQGENVIDMGDGTYYGHGIGRRSAEYIINALNRQRKRDAKKSAYLLEAAGRPDFNLLYSLHE